MKTCHLSREPATALLVLLALGVAPASRAAITFYTDRAAFTAALQAYEVEDFADTTWVPGLTVTTDNGFLANGYFTDLLNGQPPDLWNTTFSFGGPVNAFGGDFDLSTGGRGVGLQMILSTGDVLAQEVPNTSTGNFFGFISDGVFESVLLQGGTQRACCSESYHLDNLTFGVVPQGVPEPPTLASVMLAAGLAAGAVRRRRPARTSTVR